MFKNWTIADDFNSLSQNFGAITLVVSWNQTTLCWTWEAWDTVTNNRIGYDYTPLSHPYWAIKAAEKWYFHTAHLEH